MTAGQPAQALWSFAAADALEVVATAGAQARVRFLAEGRELTPVASRPAGALHLDLLRDATGRPGTWRRSGFDRRVTSGIDFAESWTLHDAETVYLRTTRRGASLVHRDAASRGETPVTPGASYRFGILAACHRLRGAVRLQLLDRARRVVATHERTISHSARGGRDRDGYDAIDIAFDAPEGASTLRIVLEAGAPEPGQDGFLFAAQPRLSPDGEVSVGSAPDQVMASWRTDLRAGARLTAWRLIPPADAAAVEVEIDGRRAGAVGTELAGGVAATDQPPVYQAPLASALIYQRRRDRVGRRLAAVRAWLDAAGKGRAMPDLDRLQALVDGDLDDEPVDAPFAGADADARVRVLLLGADDGSPTERSRAALHLAAGDVTFSVGEVVAGSRGAALGRAFNDPAVGYVLLLDVGWEPVTGWLAELLAAFEDFDDVAAAGGQRIGAGGALADGGNPRDPDFAYLREAETGAPLLLSRQAWDVVGVDGEPAGPDIAAEICRRLRMRGRRILHVPTAEFWRLPEASRDAAPQPRPVAATRPRILFVDQEAPTPDMDAGGYASFQEMRLLQAAGCDVDFLPKNLAWMDRHTLGLQRAGVRCFHAPFARDFDGFLRERAGDYAAIFVVRYKVAALALEALRGMERRPRIILNLADLHFLRERRLAAAGAKGFTAERAELTRTAELAAIGEADLTLTYSPVEAEVLASETGGQARVALCPWTAEVREAPVGFYAATSGLMFLGGFGHPPNVQAAVAFVRDVMPGLAVRLPDARLTIVGSKPTDEVLALAGPQVEVAGYVADLDEAFARTRVFVAPLLAGAGLKGKVVEAMARGVPMVLTTLAAEATGLEHEVDCLIADDPEGQADAIVRLYTDPALWGRVAAASLAKARARFGFDAGVQLMRAALSQAGLDPPSAGRLYYRRALPDRGKGASAAQAVLRLP